MAISRFVEIVRDAPASHLTASNFSLVELFLATLEVLDVGADAKPSHNVAAVVMNSNGNSRRHGDRKFRELLPPYG
jgi:hypothetical protein